MRLVGTFTQEDQARQFALYLAKQLGIENECEFSTDNEGQPLVTLWVYDEDQYPLAAQWFQKFTEDPSIIPKQELSQRLMVSSEKEKRTLPKIDAKKALRKQHPMGKCTLFFLFACIVLFLAQTFTEPKTPAIDPALERDPEAIALMLSPVEKTLFYDYPAAYALMAKLYRLYTPAQIQNAANGPQELQFLVATLNNTPYFQGIYPEIAPHLKNPSRPWSFGPTFEKIRQGEVWRTFTPCLLHGNLLHIFFNMAWFILLGPQMEQRLGSLRLLFFIILTAIVTNTAQYLMSGPNFLGFSGVICAQIGFIWMRQRKSAWEGYLLHRSTILFVGLFVLAMLALQLVSFFMELYGQTGMMISVANTAHLTGAAVGILLGSTKLFSWRPKHRT